ncbi:MAG: hypothetical protein H7069_04830 [Phormidesmis sp. FL-bin-119]|nr:hypothetical protein [Pedobacter sp.]
MNRCKLCVTNDADDTGSHVVPHFLLKRIFNVENAKGRDQEISFKISALDVQMSFGRSVQPEKLEEVFGDLSDEELEARAMADLVVDNEWCKSCEKKFADLESFYSKTLAVEKETEYQSTDDSLGALMFWLSIIWRISATGKNNLRLSAKDERKIRNLLNEYEPGKNNDEFTKKWSPVLDEISYQVYRSPDYYKKIDPEHGTFLLDGKNMQPYAIMVDEFAVLIYMKKSHLKLKLAAFFDFENLDGALSNFDSGENITPLSVEEYGSHISKVVEYMKDIKLDRYRGILNRLYRKIGHQGNMPEHIVGEIIAQMTSDERKLGRKYTHEDFVKCTTEVVLKHHVELRQINRGR